MVSYFYCRRGLFYVIVFLSSGGVYFLVFLLDFCISYSSALGGSVLTVVLSVIKGWSP